MGPVLMIYICRFRKLSLALDYISSLGTRCIKLTIDGNFAINGNYHGNLDSDWLLSPFTMVVAIDGKVTINGKFYATGSRSRSASISAGRQYGIIALDFALFLLIIKMKLKKNEMKRGVLKC